MSTNQEILEKAITKAIAGGWEEPWSDCQIENEYVYGHPKSGGTSRIWVNDLIFNHDFAKALWGEDKAGYWKQDTPRAGMRTWQDEIKGWQYHLQQMVIADDPIKYLGDNI